MIQPRGQKHKLTLKKQTTEQKTNKKQNKPPKQNKQTTKQDYKLIVIVISFCFPGMTFLIDAGFFFPFRFCNVSLYFNFI